jgi:plastin-1
VPCAIPNTPSSSQFKSSPGSSPSVHAQIAPVTSLAHADKATDSSQHTVDEEEVEQFVLHINSQLDGDQLLQKSGYLPIDAKSNQLFERCHDGILLSKLINNSVSDTIDERALNKSLPLNTFQATENNNLVINSAKAIGCSVVNIGSQDLIEGRSHLVLGLVWQVIKKGLFHKINLQYHPELYRLLDKNEKLEDFLKLPAESILLRWFNFHLKSANWHRTVTNFTNDINDSENYIVLLHQLCPNDCSLSGLKDPNLLKRAEGVLVDADKIGCRQYVTAKAIVNGNPKLNIAFVANLFNEHPGLERLSEAELAELDDGLFASKGDRESRAFALWMNSLPVEPFVHCIYDDLRDGRVLLQVIDKIRPGIVIWKKVGKPSGNASRFQCLENTNSVIDLCKSHLRLSLVGTQGADITDGNQKLILGLVWQLMRQHIIETLIRAGLTISDDDVIISWANKTVGNSYPHISSFKDQNIRSSLFIIHLLDKISPNTIDFNVIDQSDNADENALKLNAKYAISVARKIGATIFVLPEDILEVRSKLVLTFIGTLMALKA